MDWQECCGKRLVKEVDLDVDMIRSLKKASDNKLASAGKLPLEPITASSIISLSYDSLRELLEALSLEQRYKIYSHECYTAFLKEIVKASEQGDLFDEIRKIRNAINYYGKETSPEETQQILTMIKNLRAFVHTKFK